MWKIMAFRTGHAHKAIMLILPSETLWIHEWGLYAFYAY